MTAGVSVGDGVSSVVVNVEDSKIERVESIRRSREIE